MKFLDLFGKTRTHPLRDVRGPSRPGLSVDERRATTRKIDAIESDIASEIASEIAPEIAPGIEPALAAGPVALLRQQIEEASLLHASGQSAAAAALLAEATAAPVPDDAPAEQRAWLMRLELAGFAGAQARFEDIALGYARRFETSPPQWRSPQAPAGDDESPIPAVSFRGRLCGSAQPALARLAQMASRHDRFSLDLAGVTEVDVGGSRLLLELLHRWRGEGRHVECIAIDGLLGLLRQHLSEGRRDRDDAAWRLLIELLGAGGRTQEHEDACLAYSLTYEVSPPAGPTPTACAVPGVGRPGHLLLPAEIRCPVDDTLERIRAAGRAAGAIVLDCRRLQRIEFGAAAPMLAGIRRVAGGKPVEWCDVPCLVSTLLQLVGDDAMSITHRKP